jgi:menaquinone-9 beta-reductase
LKKITTEICIIGAGPAGLSAALFLAKNGISSTVVEKQDFPRDKICGDAFSGKVLWALKQLDPRIEEEIVEKDFQLPSWGVKFYGTQNNELKVPFKLEYNSASDKAPGFISSRLNFDNYLYQLASKNPLIEMIPTTTFSIYEKTSDGIVCSTSDKTLIVNAKLIIAADGAYSKVAKDLMNFSVDDEYNSLGLRAYYKNVSGLDQEGFIELHFLKELLPGYFWIFPMANGMSNVGAGIRTDLMRKHKINLKEVFNKIILEHPIIAERFKNAELVDKIKLHGLPLGKPNRKISDERVILTGDAAALIDPFTGEGIGNAIISGMLAAETATQCIHKQDFSQELISQYDKAIYRRMGSELMLSKKMQDLTKYPWLFNFIVNKASNNTELKETISCMFENVDLRSKFKNPLFYLRILLN